MADAKTFQDLNDSEIRALTIQNVCERAKALGQDSVMWQHPLNEEVKTYCEEEGYTLNPLYGTNPPSKLGQQYLITFE